MINNILHISDIHLDNYYYNEGVNNCFLGTTGLGCCRKYDFPLYPYEKVSNWGDYNCDTPFKLVNETFNWINNNINIDSIIYTGDSVNHHDIVQTPYSNIKEVKTIFNLFNTYFPNTQILHTIGNHDTYPIDQSIPYIYKIFLYNYANSVYLDNISIKDSLINGGYYSTFIKNTNIKVISLNTIYFQSNNFFKNYNNIKFKQWEWLNNELYLSEKNNESIWLLFHSPPSNSIEFKNTLFYYIDKYKEIIKITLSGHIHNDIFKLFYYNNNLISYNLIPSSLMPDKINPCFRILNYNKTNGDIYNYQQYCANLIDTINNNKIEYKITYDFNKLYNNQNKIINKDILLNIYNEIDNNDTILNNYYNNYLPNNKKKVCNKNCKYNLLNSMIIK
jgi:hypothetical protein